MTAGLIISMIWPHLASTGKIMCIIRYVNVGLFGRSWKMRRCSWRDEMGAAGRGRLGPYILNHLTFGVWGENCLELINNSPMMTTCNDSFCYGLVNPQIQLCPIRPSATHSFFSAFPLALLRVVHLGNPRDVELCLGVIPSSGWAGAAGLWGEEAGVSAQRGFCHGSSVLQIHFPPSIPISRHGEMPPFFLLRGCGLLLPEKWQTSLSADISTNNSVTARGDREARLWKFPAGHSCSSGMWHPCVLMMPHVTHFWDIVSSNNSAWKTTLFPDCLLRCWMPGKPGPNSRNSVTTVCKVRTVPCVCLGSDKLPPNVPQGWFPGDFQVHKLHQPGMTAALRAGHVLKKRSSNKNIMKRGKWSGRETPRASQEVFVTLFVVRKEPQNLDLPGYHGKKTVERSLERKPVVDRSRSCFLHKAAQFMEQVQTQDPKEEEQWGRL